MKYRAFNCTRESLLASELELADTAWTRIKGLLGRTAAEFQNGQGLWILPSEGIHTLGMLFAIDVVYLTADYRILKAYHSLPPFRIGAIKRKAASVIELPAGTLARTRTQIGDLLMISTVIEEDSRSEAHETNI